MAFDRVGPQVKRSLISILLGLVTCACVTQQNGYLNPELQKKIGRYHEAAETLGDRELDEAFRFEVGLGDLRALGKSGFQPANEFADVIEANALDLRRQDGTARPVALSRILEAFDGVEYVPPPSAGNNVSFQSIVALPRRLDVSTARWIEVNADRLPPPYLFEISRRLADRDADRAVYWFAVGMARLRYTALRCPNGLGLSDLAIMWRSYAAPSLRQFVDDGTFKKLYLVALEEILADWETTVPLRMKAWQRCEGPINEWIEANNLLRERMSASMAKHRSLIELDSS